MKGVIGKDVKEIAPIMLKDGEAVVVVWENPGQAYRLRIDDSPLGSIDWKVQPIGIVVREVGKKKAKKKTLDIN